MRAIGTAVFLLVLTLARAAPAQTVERIAAVVNDDVVSAFDVKERMRLVLFSSGIQDTPELRQRIAPQVLRALIDERLQTQEAKRLNVTVSQREIDEGIQEIEQRNRLPKGGLQSFLAENGIGFQTLLDQVRSSIAWNKVIRLRLRPRISVGDDEIDEAATRLRETQGQDEYRLAEIYLSVDTPDEEQEIRRTAGRLVEQIRGGARFDALARQFSESATAAVGGDRGWTARSELDPDFAAAVERMREGEVLDPVRTLTGYRIIALLGKRKVATPDASEIKLDLQQVFLPVGAANDVDARIAQVSAARRTVESCRDIPALLQALDGAKAQDLGTLRLADLAPQIRSAVASLDVGRASEPLQVPGGLALLVVCKREAPAATLPDRDAIGQQILAHRLDLMARRYLYDLRRAAVIDVRL